MSARHFLAALALLPALALPATAQAATGPAPAPGVPPRTAVPPRKTHFDLQAHRGGLGLTTESTLEGFAKALRLGVSTLELDTQVTRDHKVVVTHDRQVSAQKCRDTAPVVPGDPQYPYVGKYVKDLTLAQLTTMDCGYRQLPGHPGQERIAGARMVELRDVLDLVKRYRARQVTLNVETKVEAGAPEQTAPRELFVRRVYEEIRASGIERQVTVQSFDWGALKVMHRLAPHWPLVALTNHDFLQVGEPGASPWLGGIDADDYGGDFVRAAATVPGVRALSPNYGFPQNGKIGDPGFRFYPDRAMIAAAHARGLKVVPWTCDDPATVAALMDLGVDGIITDYPDRVRALMAERGMRLPKQYHPRSRPAGTGPPRPTRAPPCGVEHAVRGPAVGGIAAGTGDAPVPAGPSAARAADRVRRWADGAAERPRRALVTTPSRALLSPRLGEREIRCDAGAALATVIGKSGSGPRGQPLGPHGPGKAEFGRWYPSARRPAKARQPSTRCWRGSFEPCT